MQNMEAKITLTGSPREFDLTREALSFYEAACKHDALDKTRDPKDRALNRGRVLDLGLILGKLK